MTQYIERGMHLTDANIKKIASAINSGIGTAIQFAKDHLAGQHPLMLLKTQLAKVDKAMKMGKGLKLTFSPTQLKKMSKNGGFLQFLTPFLPMIGKALAGGVLSGLAGVAVNKIADAASGKGLANFGQKQGGCMKCSGDMIMMPEIGAKKKTSGEGLYQFGQKKPN